MMHVGQHLLAVRNGAMWVLKTRRGTEARSSMEASCDGAPEGTPGPLEGVAFAVNAHFLGTPKELLADGLLSLNVACGSAQVEERCEDVVMIAARVVPWGLV